MKLFIFLIWYDNSRLFYIHLIKWNNLKFMQLNENEWREPCLDRSIFILTIYAITFSVKFDMKSIWFSSKKNSKRFVFFFFINWNRLTSQSLNLIFHDLRRHTPSNILSFRLNQWNFFLTRSLSLSGTIVFVLRSIMFFFLLKSFKFSCW